MNRVLEPDGRAVAVLVLDLRERLGTAPLAVLAVGCLLGRAAVLLGDRVALELLGDALALPPDPLLLGRELQVGVRPVTRVVSVCRQDVPSESASLCSAKFVRSPRSSPDSWISLSIPSIRIRCSRKPMNAWYPEAFLMAWRTGATP